MQFNFPTEVTIAKGVFSKLGKISDQYGNKAFLVTGKNFLESTGLLKLAVSDLVNNGIQVTHFFDVPSNPTDESINKAIQLAVKEECNLVIAIGGGSVIDTAKMVSVCIDDTNNSWDFFRDPYRLPKPILSRNIPLIVVPTTSGTGSEVSPFAVVKNKEQNLKKGIFSNFLYPDVSLIDPEILIYLPKHLTAWTGCDAFGQALESYTSSKSSSLSDMYAFESIRLLIKYLPKAYKNSKDLLYREKVAMAAMLSGMAISFTETNLAHVLAEALGGEYDLHHGLTVGLFTPIAVKYNIENVQGDKSKVILQKYNKVVSLINNNVEEKESSNVPASEYYFSSIGSFLKKLDIPSKISEFNLTNVDVERLADLSIDMTSIKSNFVPVSKKNLIDLFNSSL